MIPENPFHPGEDDATMSRGKPAELKRNLDIMREQAAQILGKPVEDITDDDLKGISFSDYRRRYS